MQHYHPDWSFSKIGRKIGCSHSFVSRWVRRDQACEALDDQPRSGRPPKADAAAQQHIVMAAQLPECRTAGAIAAKVEQSPSAEIERPNSKTSSEAEWLAASVTSGKTHADRQAQAC